MMNDVVSFSRGTEKKVASNKCHLSSLLTTYIPSPGGPGGPGGPAVPGDPGDPY